MPQQSDPNPAAGDGWRFQNQTSDSAAPPGADQAAAPAPDANPPEGIPRLSTHSAVFGDTQDEGAKVQSSSLSAKLGEEEEPDPSQQQEDEADAEFERPLWLVWLFLGTVYIILLYPLSRWIRQINSNDVSLNNVQQGAFVSKISPVESPAARRPPELPSIPAVPYNRGGLIQSGGAEVQSQESHLPYYGADKSRSSAPAARQAPPSRPAAPAGSSGAPPSQGSLMEDAVNGVNKRLTIFGAVKGAMTSAVEQAADRPSVVKAMLNSNLIVDGLLSRPVSKAMLDNEQALVGFVMTSPTANNFLSHPLVQGAISNDAVIDAIANSAFVDRVLQSPAIQQLLSDPQTMNFILEKNPAIAAIVDKPSVTAALKANPVTAPSYAAVMMLRENMRQQQQR
ncbi:MAG: hypothetical protein WC421_07990 [Elusimicrobiales bacterium]